MGFRRAQLKKLLPRYDILDKVANMKCFSSLSNLEVPVAMSAQSGQRQNTTDQNGADLQNLDICLGSFLNAFSRGFCSTK